MRVATLDGHRAASELRLADVERQAEQGAGASERMAALEGQAAELRSRLERIEAQRPRPGWLARLLGCY